MQSVVKTKTDQLFKNITTLRIGGQIKSFTEIETTDELTEAVNYAKQNNLPYLVIGGGSNLLVSDKGYNGLAIKNNLKGILKKDQEIIVKSGTPLQEAVDFSIEHGLAGIQKLTGIPGTVGGAVFGNAGAFGQTISDHIQQVHCLDPKTGQVVSLSKAQCGFDYRDSNFKRNGLIILEIKFQLESSESEILREEASEVLEQRLKRYPAGIKCPGSFFKNLIAANLSPETLKQLPEEKIVYGKVPAGVLLEMVGAKGDKLGNIEVASYHGNLFINKGEGSAEDFYKLAKKYADKVKEKFGISLEPEVQLINLPPL